MDDAIARPSPSRAPTGVELAWPDAEAYRTLFYGTLVPSTARHRSSMLQDLERGRPTEIDAINGYVAARGAALGDSHAGQRHADPHDPGARSPPAPQRGAMDALKLDRAALDEMLAHAREAHPDECCGALVDACRQ